MQTSRKGKYSAGIYARLSVDHKIKNESIASQIAIAKSYLAQQEEIDLYDCYIDLGESGTHFQRSGFLALMEDIRSKKVNCVIVKDFSRFGRNYIEVGNYIDKIFPFLGVRFISITDGFDSQKKEENEMDRNLKNLMNELYVNDTARKVTEVKRLCQEQESYIGGRAPYGYQIEKTEKKRTLIADRMALEVVKKIIQCYLEGKSQREIVVWLYQNQVHRPSDYRKTGHIYCKEGEILLEWQKGSIRQILKNPVYKRKEIGILTEEQYQMIQEKRIKQSSEGKNGKDRKESRRTKTERNVSQSIWKGILYCGDCNHMLSYRSDQKRKIYNCSQAKRVDLLQCKKKQITEEEISFCVVSLFQSMFQKKLQKKEDFFVSFYVDREELVEYSRKRATVCIKKQVLQITRMEIQIAAQKRIISDNYINYRAGKIGREEFLAKKAAGNKKTEYLIKQKCKKTQQVSFIHQVLEEVRDWIEMIEKGEQEWLKETIFLSCVIKRIKLFCGKRMIVQLRIRRDNRKGEN